MRAQRAPGDAAFEPAMVATVDLHELSHGELVAASIAFGLPLACPTEVACLRHPGPQRLTASRCRS